MTFSIGILHRIGTKIAHHFLLIVIVIGLVFDGWLAWNGAMVVLDQPLASDRISAKQLRVNETGRALLLENLAKYHTVTAPTGKSKAVFSSKDGN
jgi:hypothetical protein